MSMFSADPLANFVDNMLRFGLEFFGRYYGIYRGICTINADETDQGRIKVKVPAVGDYEITNWAYPIMAMGGAGYGSFWPPEKDDGVYVMFENGNTSYPIYIGGYYAKEELPEDFKVGKDNPPVARGWVTKGGHKIVLNDKSGGEEVLIFHSAGLHFKISKDGEVFVGEKDGQYEAMVKGDTLKSEFEAHTHPHPWGPTGPPSKPLPPAALSTKVKVT